LAAGEKVAVKPSELNEAVPFTAAPAEVTNEKVEDVRVVAFIFWLNVAVMPWLTEVAVPPFAGIVDTTVGAGAGTVVKVQA
jgi:hypothetical protein